MKTIPIQGIHYLMKMAPNTRMEDPIVETRRMRLRELIALWGQAEVARRTERSPTQINDMAAAPPRKPFGEKVARRMEAAARLEEFYFDRSRAAAELASDGTGGLATGEPASANKAHRTASRMAAGFGISSAIDNSATRGQYPSGGDISETFTISSGDAMRVPVYAMGEIMKRDDATPEGYVFATRVSASAFATTMESDAMPTLAPKGYILVVDPEREFEPGEDVLVLASHKGATPICRELFAEGSKRYLRPESPRYDMELLTDEWKIIGLVVAIARFPRGGRAKE